MYDTNDTDYEAFCRQELQDPYPFFARLREQEPVHWCEPLHMWLVTPYKDVLFGLRDLKRLRSDRRRMYIDPLLPENLPRAMPVIDHVCLWLQNVNPPDHTRMRALVNLAFTPRLLRNLTTRIEEITDQLIDCVCDEKEIDFVQAFCLPLPAIVICEMLGIPEEYRDRYRSTVEDLVPFSSGAGPGLNDAVDQARGAYDELVSYFDDVITERRRAPTEDLISAMAAAESDGDRLSREELFAMCAFLYVAGHETTVSLLSSGTKLLLDHPDQFRRFASDPDGTVERAIEEFLRYEPPVTRGVRVPIEDFEWHDKTVRQGETITMLIGSANRDPSVFDNPDQFDITRHPNKHLGFGHGIHFCLGAPLARIEASIAFRAIARRLPGLERAGGKAKYRPALGIRSLQRLPVRV